MTLEKKVIGNLEFDQSVSLTDPCYNGDVWCRINDVPTVPGEWECVAWISDEGDWGMRVAKLGVYLDGEIPVIGWEKLDGEVGVDAGMAGVYVRKPDFSDEEWHDFCNLCRVEDGSNVWLHDREFGGRLCGFTTSSGFGDGGYDAFAVKDASGNCVAIEIVFIGEEDEEEEEYEDEA